MGRKADREIVRFVILSMDKPFKISTLFEILRRDYQIKNQVLIVSVLDELLDTGLVKRSDMINDLIFFQSSFAPVDALA